MTFYHQNLISYETLYAIVDETIELKKKLNYSDSIVNLLFEKCLLCQKLGLTNEYETTLQAAIHLGEFFLGKETTERLVEWLNQKNKRY